MNVYLTAGALPDGYGESDMAPAPRRSEVRLHAAHACALILLCAATLFLSACGNFFSCEGKASCPTTCTTNCTGTTSTDYAYVANPATSANDISGYNLGNGTLTASTSSPYSFDYSPVTMVVTPANTFLYTASDPALTTGYIYGYSIGTGGAPGILSGGKPLVTESVKALAVSPDGKWLFVLDSDGVQVNEYSINSSTGALTYNTYVAITPGSGTTGSQPYSIAVAPSGDYIAVALGTGGLETFTLTTATGNLTALTPISPANAQAGIYAVAIDANNYLYAAGTAGLIVFSGNTTGDITNLQTYTTGNGSRSVTVNTAGTLVYVGNQGDGSISGFSIGTNAALTPVTGSPFTAPTSVGPLAFDSTNDYLIASGYNASTGIQLFSVASTGVLTSVGTAGSGASATIPNAIAATH